MLRLVLVLAFLAALGALVVEEMVVRPRVNELTEQKATAETERDAANKAKSDAEKKSKEAIAAQEKMGKELTDAKGLLESKTAEASAQRERADKFAAELTSTTKIKNDAQAALSSWLALGVEPGAIRRLQDDLKKSIEERGELQVVNKALDQKLRFTQGQLDRYVNPDAEVKLPSGLRGTVTAVSPANDFVFLDIGSNQGVIERGRMMVRRGEKLITKVQVVAVDSNHCIANVLEKWGQGDVAVQVGDAVLY